MKRNPNLIRNLISLVLFTGIFISCNMGEKNTKKECEKEIIQLKDSINQINSQMIQLNITQGGPVPTSEHNALMGYRYFAYNLKDDPEGMASPEFVDPVVTVSDFIKYANQGDITNFKGFRMYPGLTNNGSMMIISCLGKDTLSTDEKQYRIFSKNDYTFPSNPFPATDVEFDEVKNINQNYMDKIYVFGKAQDTSDIEIRQSRFYYWNEMENLLKSNIDKFDWETPEKYINYKIKMEIGYVPPMIAKELHKIWPVYDERNHIGFTVMFHIIDPDGNPLINASARRDPGSLSNYKNLYLEVGNPCPPRCGALHK